MSTVFELVRSSADSHPDLCLRSLQALLAVLEGLPPEALSADEPQLLGTSLIATDCHTDITTVSLAVMPLSWCCGVSRGAVVLWCYLWWCCGQVSCGATVVLWWLLW